MGDWVGVWVCGCVGVWVWVWVCVAQLLPRRCRLGRGYRLGTVSIEWTTFVRVSDAFWSNESTRYLARVAPPL